MKKYVKPSYEVTIFNLNESVASCPTTNTYNPVQVNCVISNHHHIFYSNCDDVSCGSADCDAGIDYNSAIIVTMGDSEYLVWQRSTGKASRPGGGGDAGSSELKNILQVGANAGLLPTDAADNWMNYHAGLITPDIDAVRNASI